MSRYSPWSLALVCIASASCHHEDSFVSLADLCAVRAEEICNARNNGCCPTPDANCMQTLEAACEVELMAIAAEPARSYDAVLADKRSNALHQAVDGCDSPTPLATFFEGGLAIGSACERGVQCESGNCAGTPTVCSDPAVIALCGP